MARHAREQLGLQRVLLVPAHTPAHKTAEEDPGPEHRLRMCELLLDGAAELAVCAIEIRRGGPSYTVDTLDAIHASHPDAELTFIVGADTASTLADWHEPAKLLELADLAIAARTGSDREGVLDAVARARGARDGRLATESVRFLDMETIATSSSEVRRRVELGEPIEDLVGPSVAAYIAAYGLYRSAAGADG